MSCTFAPSLRLKWQQEKKNTSADNWVLTVLLLSLIGKPQVFEEAVKKMWAAGRIMLRELILDINQKMIFIKVSHTETQVLVKVVATSGDTVVTAV